jgi:hypothetical protein
MQARDIPCINLYFAIMEANVTHEEISAYWNEIFFKEEET